MKKPNVRGLLVTDGERIADHKNVCGNRWRVR